MARVMIYMHDTSMKLWPKVINTTCYIANSYFLRLGTNKTSCELWTRRKPNLKYFRTFSCECYILRDGENLGKFDAKSDRGIFLSYFTKSKAYRIQNQNSQIIQESSNMVINNIGYDKDIIENQISTQELDRDNHENIEKTKDNPNDIPKSNVDPNKDVNVPQEDTFKEIRNKHKSKVPKNHPIKNIIGNMNECVVIKRQ